MTPPSVKAKGVGVKPFSVFCRPPRFSCMRLRHAPPGPERRFPPRLLPAADACARPYSGRGNRPTPRSSACPAPATLRKNSPLLCSGSACPETMTPIPSAGLSPTGRNRSSYSFVSQFCTFIFSLPLRRCRKNSSESRRLYSFSQRTRVISFFLPCLIFQCYQQKC